MTANGEPGGKYDTPTLVLSAYNMDPASAALCVLGLVEISETRREACDRISAFLHSFKYGNERVITEKKKPRK